MSFRDIDVVPKSTMSRRVGPKIWSQLKIIGGNFFGAQLRPSFVQTNDAAPVDDPFEFCSRNRPVFFLLIAWGGGVVWPDLTRFRHFCKILQVFGKFLVVYLLFGKLLSLLLANLLHYWTIFYQGKWPNIEKQSNHLVTLVGDQVSLHCIFCAFT